MASIPMPSRGCRKCPALIPTRATNGFDCRPDLPNRVPRFRGSGFFVHVRVSIARDISKKVTERRFKTMAAAVPSAESSAAGAHPAAKAFLQNWPKRLLIGGKWVPAKSGKTFETINPANEEVLGLVAEGDKSDVDEAVRAARKAFEAGKWPSMGPHQRARYLFRIAELIEENTEELAELITLDNGKPIGESVIEVGRTAETFRYYGGWSTKFYGETNPSDPGIFNYTLGEPIGVCGQIIPWNGPLATVSWKVAPALAFGNTLVLKAAEQTPLPAIRLAELICEAGVPDGVVNLT